MITTNNPGTHTQSFWIVERRGSRRNALSDFLPYTMRRTRRATRDAHFNLVVGSLAVGSTERLRRAEEFSRAYFRGQFAIVLVRLDCSRRTN